MSDYAQTFSLPITTVQSIRLPGAAFIRSITIANSSNGVVNVFSRVGASSVGTPDFTIPANANVTMPINSLSAIGLTFAGMTGSVYVHAFDGVLSAQSSAIQVTAPNMYPVIFGSYDAFEMTATQVGITYRTGGPVISAIFSILPLENTPPNPISPPDGVSTNSNYFYIKGLRITGLPPYVGWALGAAQNSAWQPNIANPSIQGFGNANISWGESGIRFSSYRDVRNNVVTRYDLVVYFYNVDGVPVATTSKYPFVVEGYGIVK